MYPKRFLSALLFCCLLTLPTAYASDAVDTADTLDEAAASLAVAQFYNLVNVINDYSLFTAEQPLTADQLENYATGITAGYYTVTEAVDTLLSEIDRYGSYYDATDYASTYASITGYCGIGVTLQGSEQGALLYEVFRGSPALEAGLQAGDVLTHIDGVAVAGLSSDEIGTLLLGEVDTTVSVTYLRDGTSTTVSMPRAVVYENTLYMQTLPFGVQYYALTSFSNELDIDALIDDWHTVATAALEAQGEAPAVILDLRGNGGGLVTQAEELTNAFVDQSDVLLFHEQERAQTLSFTSDGTGIAPSSVVVLVDGQTGSAAELTAGVLRDLLDATLIGARTYGKGMGQQHLSFSDGNRMVITTLELLLPESGGWDGDGLTTDVLSFNTYALSSVLTHYPLHTDAPLYLGDTGDAVYALSVWLNEMGYADATTTVFDLSLLTAVHKFCAQVGLPAAPYASTQMLTQLEGVGNTCTEYNYVVDSAFLTALDTIHTP